MIKKLMKELYERIICRYHTDINKNLIFDIVERTCYDISKNKFLEYNIEREYIYHTISKEKYDNLFKNTHCNCSVGDGCNIVTSKKYNAEQEINKKYQNYYIEFGSNSLFNNYTLYDVCGNYINSIKLKDYYVKKACINCGTCLDELNDLYSQFENEIDKIKQEEINKKMVDDICERK